MPEKGVHIDSYGNSRFAGELGAAFRRSPLELDAAVKKLAEAGYDVPLRALENWLRGYFLPRSEAAGELVYNLGIVLGAEPEALVRALAVDIASGRSFVPGEDMGGGKARHAEDTQGLGNPRFKQSDADTDWLAEPIRVAVEDHIHVSADLSSLRYRAVLDVRVPAAPNPSISVPLVFGRDDIPTDPRLVRDIEGARIAGQRVYEMRHGLVNVTTRLALPSNLEPGELCRVAYTVDLVREADPNKVFRRYFAWPLRSYKCRVSFEGRVPEGLVFLTTESLDVADIAGAERVELEVVDGVAEYERTDCPTGIGQVEWRLSDADTQAAGGR